MKDIISSKSNANIKYAKKLLTSAAFRSNENAFLVEGIRLCGEALKSGIKFKMIFFTEKCQSRNPQEIEDLCADSPKSYIVGEDIIKLISDTDTPQGIVGVCEMMCNEENVVNSDKLVLLENIQNPSNLGSIFRSCDALGIKEVVISADSCDIYNPKVLRGSMGAVFRLNIRIVQNFADIVSKMRNDGYDVYATVPSHEAEILGSTSFFGEKCAVVFGNEGNGITPKTISLCTKKLTIPMSANAESLNVSVAAGIVIWEMTKGGRTVEI